MNILQGLGPGVTKGTAVGQTRNGSGVGVGEQDKFGLQELVRFWGRWGPRETNRALTCDDLSGVMVPRNFT